MRPSSPPPDLDLAVRQAVRETVGGTVRAWVDEITAAELRTEEVRNQRRPLVVELVRRELETALRRRNGRPSR